MKKLYIIILSLLVSSTVVAQDNVPATASDKKPMSFQILAGSQGFGANFRYVPHKTIGIRVGGSFGKGSINDKIEIEDFSSKNKLTGEITTIHALAELNPMGFVRFAVGAAYLAKAKADLFLQPKESQTVGEVTLTPDEIGELNYHIDWGKAAPYVGIGLGRGIPKNKFNVNLDLGTYFLQSPKVTAFGTKLLSDNESSAAKIQENMKSYRFLPVAQINFNFRF
ncbi:MAG: hypothetical protein EOO99_02710 [Pedobacter sp.]|nr:MAG: hypothetical protein EOO99_02710 [Pedobacter sp.]